ncbi:MAG: quinolinate synthase NadA [Dehalococcoidia bacterium]
MTTAKKNSSEILQHLQSKLSGIVPDFELKLKAELAYEINLLKEELNAVILGHNYMEPALFHSIPDFVGDSLELSRRAAETDKDVIVFCGVQFMAETAKILSPDKKVLIPSQKAGCSLASSITADDVKKLKQSFPGVPVVTYVNTYADVKAECDICCTSSNAAAVVQSLGVDQVIFIPDEYLSKNVAVQLGHKIAFPNVYSEDFRTEDYSDFQMIGWAGRCEVHEKFTVEDINTVRKQFSDVLILSHPECSPEVVEASDFSGSTNAMIRYTSESRASRYLLLTECSMGDNIASENPEKEMLRLCSVRCPHMNQITLEDTLECLKKSQYEVDVPRHIAERAARSVQRMIQIG